jgi:hypothetical protein
LKVERRVEVTVVVRAALLAPPLPITQRQRLVLPATDGTQAAALPVLNVFSMNTIIHHLTHLSIPEFSSMSYFNLYLL